MFTIRFRQDKSARPLSISYISYIFITAMKRLLRLFAVASPLMIWFLFYFFICYGFGGLTWLIGTLSNTCLLLWFLMIVATAIVGSCASGICFVRGSSKKVLYFVTFCHDLLFSLFLFSWMLQHFLFFNRLSNGLLKLTFLMVACWFIAVIVHVVQAGLTTKEINRRPKLERE